MSKQIYNWKRFWCPRSGNINLADGGYLCDPDAEWGKTYNPDLVALEAIAHLPCLALLGEPGIGKTQALEAERTEIFNKIQEQGDQVLFLDLRSYGDESRLVRKLFESPQFTTWQTGTNQLHIFLDSFDECLLRVDTLATLLVDEFKDYRNAIKRLYLRVACRTAIWQSVLEEGLKEIWGENSVGVYELAPLRRVDIIEAAKAQRFSPDDFLREVRQKNIVPLAIKPVTLEFLLNIYRRHDGQFPPNQRLHELYLEGCKILCEERNNNRRDSNRRGNLDVDQRLMVAARIAAITIFANRFAVWTGVDQGNVPAEDVLLQTLCHGYENANGREFEITRVAIEEVLDTGLFSSRGELHRMGWAHQTYSEFLAAWYLVQHRLNLSQVLNLIIHPDRRVVPQLQETTAWLAGMMPEVFQEVMKTDPDVLLQSDISTVDHDNKAKLVESLLNLHNEEKLSYQLRRYNNLDYPGLAAQLEPYIRDSAKSQWARFVAIDMVKACGVALQDSLVDVVLNPMQPYMVQTHAARTICDIGNENTKARLKPLALGEAGNDPDDDLKGYSLEAVYPKHLKIEELLLNITQPKSSWIGGAYSEFIARKLAEKLPLSDLPVVLKYLEKLPLRSNLNYPFIELADSVMLKAWKNLEDPEILEGFSRVAYLRLKKYEKIIGSSNRNPQPSFRQELEDDDDKRHHLIEAVISILPDSVSDPSILSYDGSHESKAIVLEKDFSWLIERLLKSNSERIQKIYAKLINDRFRWNYQDRADVLTQKQLNDLLAVAQNNLVLKEEFNLEPIELNSQRAKQAEASYLQSQNRSKRSEPEPLLDPPPKQRVLAILEKVEAGQPELWWQIVVEMTLLPTSKEYIYDHIFESGITKLSGWEAAEADTKARTIATAKNYLDAGDPETQKWIGTNNFSHPWFAGYQALYLLAKQEPAFISTISSDIWTKWIPVILKSVNFPHGNGESKDEACRAIVRTAHQSDLDKFIETLIVLMIQNNYQPGTFYPDDVYRLTCELLDQCLASEILSRIPVKDLNAGMLEILLTDLFKHDVDQAKSIAVSFVETTVPESGEARNKAIAAARLLASHPDNSSWSMLWSAVQQDHEFGREVLEAIAFQSAHEGQIEQKIKENYLADLYIFLTQQYPEIEQPELETQELRGIEAQILGEFDGVRMWKNYIPQRLQERGTKEACEALRRIIYELPELKDKLQWRLLEAEALTRRQTWQPPQPEEILQIIFDQDKRLVQNGHHLLEVLIESLNRLELELQGETSACRDLWDKDMGRDNLFRPIDENAFSDYVKRFLDRDLKSRGIIANREVELRRSYGGRPGERTDIHVDAILKRPNGEAYDSITAIIEVKGCWHPEVQTAMKSQLVERYLAENFCKYGLYLIGWFNCQQWDNQDSRKNKTPKMSIDEVKKQFDEQAETLSSSGNIVRAYVLNTALR